MDESRAERDRELCLAAIGSSIHECQYKKSLETAKEYIDFLFRSNENMNIIRGRTVEFMTGLAALGVGLSPYGDESEGSRHHCLIIQPGLFLT